MEVGARRETSGVRGEAGPRRVIVLGTLLALAGLGGSGCSGPLVLNEKMGYGGLTRTYVVEAPRWLDGITAVPLLVVLHGSGQTADEVRRATQYGQLVADLGFLAVYPEAVGLNWNDGRDVPGFPSYDLDVDDVGFIGAVIDRVSGGFAVDQQRVYVAGLSNGALMIHRLALEAPERFAAAAAVAGAMPENLLDLPPPNAPMPMLIMNGTSDEVVPWEGGAIFYEELFIGTLVSVPDTVAFWVAHNECIQPAQMTALDDTAPGDGTRVYEEYYAPGPDQAEVVFYRIEGGGHAWPGGTYGIYSLTTTVSQDMDASRVIWEFFSKYERE